MDEKALRFERPMAFIRCRFGTDDGERRLRSSARDGIGRREAILAVLIKRKEHG